MIKTFIASLCAIGILIVAPVRAQDKASVSVAAPWEVTSTDPAVSGFAFQRLQVLESLVDANAEGALRPGLATSWEASSDGLTWSFKLRAGVSFHDGSAFDAAAAAGALSRAWQQPGVMKKAPITGIDAGDDAVIFKLEKPFAALPAIGIEAAVPTGRKSLLGLC